MGLDNGIIVKGKTERGKEFLNEYFDFLRDKYSSDSENTYELAYWRKCWNIRNRMFEQIYCAREGISSLTLSDLSTVVEKVLKYFLNEENWNGEYGQSIWEWYIMVRQIGVQIYNIRRFLEEIEYSDEELNDSDFEIYFYDSY